MVEIICVIITGASAIIVAFVGASVKKTEKLAVERAQENLLLLKMMNANCDLTVGTALALKRGHCNGEMESGLAAIKEAQDAYQDFHDKLAIAHLNK